MKKYKFLKNLPPIESGTMKSGKCPICGRRFLKQEWKKGIERMFCFTCRTLDEYVETIEKSINTSFEIKKDIELTWKYREGR